MFESEKVLCLRGDTDRWRNDSLWRVIGYGRDGVVLFSHDETTDSGALSCSIHLWVPLAGESEPRLLYTVEDDKYVVSASITSERTLLAMTTSNIEDGKCTTNILELKAEKPRLIKMGIPRDSARVHVQFVLDTPFQSHCVVMAEGDFVILSSISVYWEQKKGRHLCSMGRGSVKQKDRLVQRPTWFQYLPENRSLYVLHHAKSQKKGDQKKRRVTLTRYTFFSRDHMVETERGMSVVHFKGGKGKSKNRARREGGDAFQGYSKSQLDVKLPFPVSPRANSQVSEEIGNLNVIEMSQDVIVLCFQKQEYVGVKEEDKKEGGVPKSGAVVLKVALHVHNFVQERRTVLIFRIPLDATPDSQKFFQGATFLRYLGYVIMVIPGLFARMIDIGPWHSATDGLSLGLERLPAPLHAPLPNAVLLPVRRGVCGGEGIKTLQPLFLSTEVLGQILAGRSAPGTPARSSLEAIRNLVSPPNSKFRMFGMHGSMMSDSMMDDSQYSEADAKGEPVQQDSTPGHYACESPAEVPKESGSRCVALLMDHMSGDLYSVSFEGDQLMFSLSAERVHMVTELRKAIHLSAAHLFDVDLTNRVMNAGLDMLSKHAMYGLHCVEIFREYLLSYSFGMALKDAPGHCLSPLADIMQHLFLPSYILTRRRSNLHGLGNGLAEVAELRGQSADAAKRAIADLKSFLGFWSQHDFMPKSRRSQLKDHVLFKVAFYSKDEKQAEMIVDKFFDAQDEAVTKATMLIRHGDYEENERFSLYQSLMCAVESADIPPPKCLREPFSVLAAKCLPRDLFLQYLARRIISPRFFAGDSSFDARSPGGTPRGKGPLDPIHAETGEAGTGVESGEDMVHQDVSVEGRMSFSNVLRGSYPNNMSPGAVDVGLNRFSDPMLQYYIFSRSRDASQMSASKAQSLLLPRAPWASRSVAERFSSEIDLPIPLDREADTYYEMIHSGVMPTPGSEFTSTRPVSLSISDNTSQLHSIFNRIAPAEGSPKRFSGRSNVGLAETSIVEPDPDKPEKAVTFLPAAFLKRHMENVFSKVLQPGNSGTEQSTAYTLISDWLDAAEAQEFGESDIEPSAG